MTPVPERHDLSSIWSEGRATLGTSLALGSILSAEALFALDYHSVTIDMQHGVISQEQLAGMLRAAVGTRAVPFVRVSANDPAEIMRTLDAGALGLFCPAIESAQAAAAFVSACRYPPHGSRSIGPLLAEVRHGSDYVTRAAIQVMPFAMIETAAGFDELDSILSVDGLTGVYVGTADLSLSLGKGPRYVPGDQELDGVIETIVRRTHAAGRIAAVHVGSAAYAGYMRKLGYAHIVVSSDYRLLVAAAASMHSELTELLRQYET